jgi:hypothetical protein
LYLELPGVILATSGEIFLARDPERESRADLGLLQNSPSDMNSYLRGLFFPLWRFLASFWREGLATL